jgi:hypothetical protein
MTALDETLTAGSNATPCPPISVYSRHFCKVVCHHLDISKGTISTLKTMQQKTDRVIQLMTHREYISNICSKLWENRKQRISYSPVNGDCLIMVTLKNLLSKTGNNKDSLPLRNLYLHIQEIWMIIKVLPQPRMDPRPHAGFIV